MTRTPGDTARRSDIAAAAAGFCGRATVVLYDRINLGQDQQEAVARLRRHAEARDWVVVAEVIEYGPPETTSPAGQGWQTVRRFVGSRQAMGIVTTSRRALAAVDSLDEWLLEQRAFVSETAPAATEEATR
ncbi:hypothetical protein ABT033_31100 [Streptomyces pharetrae]|uniref:hypothetical protein n=1 Tax=Streptomyces pharetrae TaxID=291370 RepID=UPI0033559901